MYSTVHTIIRWIKGSKDLHVPVHFNLQTSCRNRSQAHHAFSICHTIWFASKRSSSLRSPQQPLITTFAFKSSQAMKAAFVTLCAVAFLTPSSSDAIQSPTHRQLILEGSIVPAKTKTYTVGLRHSVDGENVCGGSLIGPKHVLTASQCASYDIRWASIGSHYLNGTEDSEQIKVLSVMNNPNFSANVAYSDDFCALELESASAFKPVKLASSDDSDFKAGATATALGWGSRLRRARCPRNCDGLTCLSSARRAARRFRPLTIRCCVLED